METTKNHHQQQQVIIIFVWTFLSWYDYYFLYSFIALATIGIVVVAVVYGVCTIENGEWKMKIDSSYLSLVGEIS